MSELIVANPWLILAIPLATFLLVGLVLRPWWPRLAGYVATVGIGCTFAAATTLAVSFFSQAPFVAKVIWQVPWIHFQDGVDAHLGLLLDPISAMLFFVVTGVSTLVHIYSLGYMKGDTGIARYFTYLGLFTFSMLGLVAAPNLFQMFVFWELVGASSFLLIGFYFEKPSAVSAAKKAFIVTRFADLGFLIGMILLGWFGFQLQLGLANKAGPFDFLFLTSPQTVAALATYPIGLALGLVFMGAAGKSAMFPLHIWLPDAMEGPTPVSALIHAATMVVAGVYMVARLFPLFASVPAVLESIAAIGAFTSLFAALVACTQDDIKRILAFSTLSQIGYMMWALGVATIESPLGYTASMFHLFTHAFFKALLFLGAGALIHAVHSNDIWHMGGLMKKMPWTHICVAVAWLAICGVWPFAGFFSKDEMLLAALENGHRLIFSVGLLTAGLTAFYMSRLYFVAFWGSPRSNHASHAHEAPVLMVLPLVVLAVGSAVSGLLPFSEYVALKPLEHSHSAQLVAALGSVAAVSGIVIAWLLYVRSPQISVQAKARLGQVYGALKAKLYIDEAYLFLTKQVIFRFVANPISWFDRNVVDGGVDLTGRTTRVTGHFLSLAQNGQVQAYGSWFVLGAVALAFFRLLKG